MPFLDGTDFGTGINTLKLIPPRRIGVHDANGSPPATVRGGGGDTVVFQLQRPKSKEDIYSALNLDASVLAPFILFPVLCRLVLSTLPGNLSPPVLEHGGRVTSSVT